MLAVPLPSLDCHHNSLAHSTSASPSLWLLPCLSARAVATSVAVATAADKLACQRLRAYPASSLASAFSPSPPPASRRRRRLVTGPQRHYHHWQQSRPRVKLVVGAHDYQPRISGMWAKNGGAWAKNIIIFFCPANLAFCPPKCTFCPDPLLFCPALYVRKCLDISEDLLASRTE